MITGDSRETAIAIARDVNIFKRDEDVSRKAFKVTHPPTHPPTSFIHPPTHPPSHPQGADFFKLSEQEQRSILRSGKFRH